MNKWLISLSALAVTGYCALFLLLPKPPENLTDAKELYETKRHVFDELKNLILAERKCREVGTNRIGDYWRSGERWSRHQKDERLISTAELLARYDIPEARYDKYTRLLESVFAETVVARPLGHSQSPQVEICVYSIGLVTSGYSISLIHQKTPDTEREPYEVVHRLQEDWALLESKW